MYLWERLRLNRVQYVRCDTKSGSGTLHRSVQRSALDAHEFLAWALNVIHSRCFSLATAAMKS